MSEEQINEQPINRERRSYFCIGTTLLSICLAATMAFMGIDNQTAQIVADGLISIAIFIGGFYVTGSVVDRSKILNEFGKK